MSEGTGDLSSESPFDWRHARWTPLYPAPELLAEMGRVTIAAARVDRQLALALLAIKQSKDFEGLLKKNSNDLYKILRRRLVELFDGSLLEWATANLEEVRKRIEVRHQVSHSIWNPGDHSDRFSVELLAGIRCQEEVDSLLFERGASAEWETLHPKTGGPGPQTLNDLKKARADLEDAAQWLEGLRFKLASALFAGGPSGARQVPDPRSFD